MKENEFKCAVCGGIFEKELTDKEAEEQLEKEFGDNWITEDCDIVCDDCFQKIFNPKERIQKKIADEVDKQILEKLNEDN